VERLDLPFGVVTVTSTVPAVSNGAVTKIDVAEVTLNCGAGTVPKVTCKAPVRFVPVRVIVVPPPVGPDPGVRLVNVGSPAAADRKSTRLNSSHRL